MSVSVVEVKEELFQLQQFLLSTLNEYLFFKELTRFLKEKLGEDHVIVFKVFPDQSVQFIAHNGETFDQESRLKEGGGPSAHVAHTKRPYYSNNLARDPLFNKDLYRHNVVAECVVPIAIDGSVVATLHIQSSNTSRQYGLSDIQTLKSYLNEIGRPLVNLHMYLAVKNLNEVLLEKIQEREASVKSANLPPYISLLSGLSQRELFEAHPSFEQLKESAKKLSMSPLDALIIGEQGTGKTALAKIVHQYGGRDDRPLVIVNGRLVAEYQDTISSVTDLLSDLYRKAKGGTLVVDHTEMLPSFLQVAWRDFIQTPEGVEGRAQVRAIFLAGTALEEKVLKGDFDRGFYDSFHDVFVRLRSLSKYGRDEFLSLALHLLNKNGEGAKDGTMKVVSEEALELLLNYPWPGNFAELQKMMESFSQLSKSEIEKNDLPELLHLHLEEVKKLKENNTFLTLETVEREHICNTLKRLDGNKTRAAKALGITVKTLYNKLHLYNMV